MEVSEHSHWGQSPVSSRYGRTEMGQEQRRLACLGLQPKWKQVVFACVCAVCRVPNWVSRCKLRGIGANANRPSHHHVYRRPCLVCFSVGWNSGSLLRFWQGSQVLDVDQCHLEWLPKAGIHGVLLAGGCVLLGEFYVENCHLAEVPEPEDSEDEGANKTAEACGPQLEYRIIWYNMEKQVIECAYKIRRFIIL